MAAARSSPSLRNDQAGALAGDISPMPADSAASSDQWREWKKPTAAYDAGYEPRRATGAAMLRAIREKQFHAA